MKIYMTLQGFTTKKNLKIKNVYLFLFYNLKGLSMSYFNLRNKQKIK